VGSNDTAGHLDAARVAQPNIIPQPIPAEQLRVGAEADVVRVYQDDGRALVVRGAAEREPVERRVREVAQEQTPGRPHAHIPLQQVARRLSATTMT